MFSNNLSLNAESVYIFNLCQTKVKRDEGDSVHMHTYYGLRQAEFGPWKWEERTNWLLKFVLWPPYTCWGMYLTSAPPWIIVKYILINRGQRRGNMEGEGREEQGRKGGVANAQKYLFNICIKMRKRRDLGQKCPSINLDLLAVPEITSITLHLSGKAFITKS